LNDSLHISADSVQQHLLDSLNHATAYHWDTLHIAVPATPAAPLAPTGFVGEALASSAQSEAWVFVALLLMAFLPIFVISSSPAWLSESFKMIFKEKKRASIFSDTSTSDPVFRSILFVFFSVAVGLYAFCYFHNANTDFAVSKGIVFCGVTLVFFLVKTLLIRFLTYVFFDSTIIRQATEQYVNILSVCGLVVYPLLVLQIYVVVPIHNYLNVITALVLILSILFVVIKIFRIFFTKIIDLLYILLYLCTLELIPIFGLIHIYQLIG
jgi:hypothetical protein